MVSCIFDNRDNMLHWEYNELIFYVWYPWPTMHSTIHILVHMGKQRLSKAENILKFVIFLLHSRIGLSSQSVLY